MRKRAAAAILFVLATLPSVIYGQPCAVDSGQTVAFTLAAGARAAWDQSSMAVLQRQVQWQKVSSFSAHQSSAGDIVFHVTGVSSAATVRISLYTINGRRVGTTAMSGRTIGAFGRKLPPGIYLACCEADGTIVRTVRFIAGRQP